MSILPANPVSLTPFQALRPTTGLDGSPARALIEHLPGAAALLDLELRYVAVNQLWINEYQIQNLPVIGVKHYELFPDLHDGWKALYNRCLQGDRHTSEADLLVRPDGSQDWVRWDIDPWKDSTGAIAGLIMRSTVEQMPRPATAKDNAAQRAGRAIVQGHNRPLILLDKRGVISHANDTAKALARGSAIVEGTSFFWNVMFPHASRARAQKRIQELLADSLRIEPQAWPRLGGDELHIPAQDGTVSWNILPGLNSRDEPDGLLLYGLDTPRPGSPSHGGPADDLGELRLALDSTPFGLVILTDEADLVYANASHNELLGFSIVECGSMTAWLERGLAAHGEQQGQASDAWWNRVWRRHNADTFTMRTKGGLAKDIEFRPTPFGSNRVLLTITDVTDARSEHLALSSSQARYRDIFMHSTTPIVILNGSGNITEMNAELEKLTGCSRMELRRGGMNLLIPPAEAQKVREALSNPTQEIDTLLHSKKGAPVPARLRISQVKNDKGTTAFTICCFTPSTAPQHSPTPQWDALQPDLGLILDPDTTITHAQVGRDFTDLTSPDLLIGSSISSSLPDIAAALPLDVMIQRLTDTVPETRCEFTTTYPDNDRPRFIEARMTLHHPTSDTAPPSYSLILRDLTASLPSATRQSSSGPISAPMPWLKNVSIPFIITNDKGRITGMNPAAEELTGWATADLQGSGLYRLFAPDSPREFGARISTQLSQQRRWKETATLLRRDGTTTAVDIDLVPAVNEGTGSRGFMASLLPTRPEPTHAIPAELPRSGSVSLHRARNDLQILTSLLTLDTDRHSDGPTRLALKSGKDRLTAVALIYRHITDETDTVDFAKYARDLGRALLEGGRPTENRVTIETNFQDIRLPQKTAITLGIILQELINESLADAFLDEAKGTIKIGLTAGMEEGILTVGDSGQLLSESMRHRRLGSFSWHIVEMLCNQLHGTISLLSDLQNQVRLRFRIQN